LPRRRGTRSERIEEALFLIGRRGGKDRASAVLVTYLAALVDWSGVLAKGERGLVLCIGADQRQATVQRDYIEGVFAGSVPPDRQAYRGKHRGMLANGPLNNLLSTGSNTSNRPPQNLISIAICYRC
jgi:hypothetical protein